MATERHEGQESDLPPGLASPGRRALASSGFWRLEQLAQHRESEIRNLHGMGPKALDQLRLAMAAKGLSFVPEKGSEEKRRPGKS